MKRRDFLQKSVAMSMLASTSTLAMSNLDGQKENLTKRGSPFRLNYAPHLGMFSSVGADPLTQLHHIADLGFRAFEDNKMRQRPIKQQEEMANVMSERKLKMGVFVAHTIHWKTPSLTSGNTEYKETFLSEIRDSVLVAKRVNAKWLTVVPGHLDLSKDIGYQTVNVINILKEAADILAAHDLIMVLEPLNFRNHPGLFLTRTSQAFEICQAVNSPSCKILFDIYHQQIQEGNLIPNIEAAWNEIAYFQIGDNPGRNEPTSGEINYRNVFKYIFDKGFTGILGMEHGNSMSGYLGEQKVVAAYRESDNF